MLPGVAGVSVVAGVAGVAGVAVVACFANGSGDSGRKVNADLLVLQLLQMFVVVGGYIHLTLY